MAIWQGPHRDDFVGTGERRARIRAVSPDFMQKFGRELFGALFGDAALKDAYRQSGNAPLLLDLPEDLLQLPWEMMNDGEYWVAQSRGIARLTTGEAAPPPATDEKPLRVLALLAMPVLDQSMLPTDSNQPYVGDVEKHAGIFQDFDGKAWPVRFRVIRHARPDDLRAGVSEGAEVLYYLGHGSEQGVCFDDGYGRIRRVEKHALRQRLHGSGVRVVVTNSCRTASLAEGGDPVTALIIEAGVPVVVGMQVPISDAAAQCFATAFFETLARGKSPLEAAKQARAALQDAYNPGPFGEERSQQPNAWEWITPVVFVSDQAFESCAEAVAVQPTGTAEVVDEARQRLSEPGFWPQRPMQFVGRRQELVDIAESLEQCPVTILHGMRGVGKTTLALEAVHRAARRFDRLVWVRARVESPADELSGASADSMSSGRISSPIELINRVAEALDVAVEQSREKLLVAIRQKLAECRILLILDNLDSFAEKGKFVDDKVLRDLLGVLPHNSRALITVAGDLEAPGRRIPVQGLPPKIAALLVYYYAREMGVEIDGAEVGVIATSTGGHPMAIRFAIGLLSKQQDRREIIDGLRGRSGRPVEEVLGYVMGRAVEQAAEDTRLLFTLASHFPSPILRDLLEAGALWNDKDRFRRALAEAVDLILLETVEGEYVLIQELQRAEAKKHDLPLPQGPAHGRAMVEWAGRAKDELLFCDLVNSWETYCSQRGHLEIWEPYGREAVQKAQELSDPVREMFARNDLGLFCIPTGKLAEGLTHFNRYLQLAKKLGYDADQATALGNMGLIYADQGEPARALDSYQKAYEIGERLNNPQIMASTLCNMGLIYARQGELARALECYENAYKIAERLNNPQTMANTLGNMGLFYADQGEPARALECHQKAYEIDVRLNNPQGQAEDLGNMGLIYARLGEQARALDSYEKAYAIGERLNNPELMASALGNMGIVYASQGNMAKAKELLNRAKEIYEKVGIKGQGPEVAARALGLIDELEHNRPG